MVRSVACSVYEVILFKFLKGNIFKIVFKIDRKFTGVTNYEYLEKKIRKS